MISKRTSGPSSTYLFGDHLSSNNTFCLLIVNSKAEVFANVVEQHQILRENVLEQEQRKQLRNSGNAAIHRRRQQAGHRYLTLLPRNGQQHPIQPARVDSCR